MAGYLPSNVFANIVHGFTAPNVDRPPSVTYTVQAPNPIAAPDVLASQLHDAFASNLVPNLDSNWQLETTTVYVGPTPSTTGATFTNSLAGGRTGAAPPPQTALLVTKQTSFIGRASKGRLYFPAGFMAEELIDESGNYQAAAVANFQADLDGWLSEMAGYAPMMLAHTGTATNPPGAPPYPVNELVADSLVATQRRRLRG